MSAWITMGDYEGCLRNWGKAAALPPKHALTLTASMQFSIGIPAKRLTFYLQPQKVSKKGRSLLCSSSNYF
jgi:hypothetical protein